MFDSNGVLLPRPPASEAEKASTLAFLKAVYTGEGLALSHCRAPGSTLSLQRVEDILNALIADGSVAVEARVTGRGGFNLYKVVNNG